MLPDGPDDHPLMAALYDLENPWCARDDTFLAIAERRPRSTLLDLGCGTGTLTIALARAGHDVTGVDPNRSFLDAAQAKPGAEAVRWIHGTSEDLGSDSTFDVALLTGNVVHAFVDDDEWRQLLVDLRNALAPDGVLAFDARDPDVRGWEAWAGGWSGELPDGQGPFETRSDIRRVDGDVVTFEVDTTLPGGERRHGVSRYRFRSTDAITDSLQEAGYRVDDVSRGDGGLVFVTTKRATSS